jgi:hypothetical protein
VTPLLPLLEADARFYVLALSQHNVRLLHCSRESASEIDLHGFPHTLEQANLAHEKGKPFSFFGRREGAGNAAQGIFHGHGVGLDDKKGELLQLCQKIDHGLRTLLQGERIPLVLAAVDYLQSIYREANSYPQLMERGITGSPERSSDQQLHDAAWELLKPQYEAAQQQVLAQFRRMAGTGMTLEGLEDVVAAAYDGRIETLLLPRGQQVWGTFQPKIGKVECHDRREVDDQELLNLAAVETLKHGHKVRAIEPERMPVKDGPAAILCHPLAKRGKRP